MCRRLSHVLAIQLLIMFVCMGEGHALPILQFDGVTFDDSDDWYVYSYSLGNSSDATDYLFWLELTGLAPHLEWGVDNTPGGWSIVSEGDDLEGHGQIDWWAEYTGALLTYEVHPGGILPDFVLHSTAGPGQVTWWAFGCDDQGGGDPTQYSGRTTGPAPLGAVPEPCSALLLLLAGVGVAMGRPRRRSEQS